LVKELEMNYSIEEINGMLKPFEKNIAYISKQYEPEQII
jgi:hypothetical protein